MPSLVVAGMPYQYEAEANAGISLDTGERWWGTLVRWRPGTYGRWHRTTLVDVHPMDGELVERALRAWLTEHHR